MFRKLHKTDRSSQGNLRVSQPQQVVSNIHQYFLHALQALTLNAPERSMPHRLE